jgi:hypothetical protein
MKIKEYWNVFVGDYHEFDGLVDAYKAAGLTKIKFEEIDCHGSKYEAVFWTGKKPIAYIKERKEDYNNTHEED